MVECERVGSLHFPAIRDLSYPLRPRMPQASVYLAQGMVFLDYPQVARANRGLPQSGHTLKYCSPRRA